jgi:DNA-binding PadR family transcriptional regulator
MPDPIGDPGLAELGRFAEPALFILVALGDGPKHGYAIMNDVEVLSGQPLGPGTLYAALSRLERRGLIEALEPEDRRRPYRLTPTGTAALEVGLEALATLVRTGRARMRGSTG